MNSNSTKKIVYLNAFVTLFSQFLQVILGFVIRKVFIDTLGIAYLGYNSVFSNILQMLNLADLGIGVAITSFLYKPLVDGNEKQINALMYIYSRIYHVMGCLVAGVGMIVLVFVPALIPDAACSDTYLRILFAINLVGTVSTYFLAYKRTLLIAQQKSYLVTAVDSVFYVICTVAQIILLYLKPNYVVYLCLTVLKNIASNIILMVLCNRKNTYLSNACVEKEIIEEYKKPIFTYVKDLFVSRIGAYVYYGTDNIIISVFKGSLLTGFLSNYTMVTNLVNNVIVQILSSLQATYGQYIAGEKELRKQKNMTYNYFFMNFLAGNFCMICIMFLIQPFVTLYFGPIYVLSNTVVVLLSINFLLTILIQIPSQVFVVYKLYKYDYPIVITSAILNIVISIALVQKLEIAGVLIGTMVTSLIYLFSRFFIITKFVFKSSYLSCLLKIGGYFLTSFITVLAAGMFTAVVAGTSWMAFVLRGVGVGILSILIPVILLSRTSEWKFIFEKFVPNKLRNKKCIALFLAVCIGVLGLVAVLGKTNAMVAEQEGNKSLARKDSYAAEYQESSDGYMHISLDDVSTLFAELTERQQTYSSLFEHPTLAWMRDMHEEYGAVFSCYVYYSTEEFSLKQCTDAYKAEFTQNADWLKFGFHTYDENTTYEKESAALIVQHYVATVKELTRIVGEESIDNVIRLQSYAGSLEAVTALARAEYEPVTGLLTADDKRQSYYLDTKENDYIYSHDRYRDVENGITFYSTDLRIELLDSAADKIKEFSKDSWNNQLNELIIFTHEWQLS